MRKNVVSTLIQQYNRACSSVYFHVKKKFHASELKHMKQNILLRTSKERTLIFYQHTLRQDNFSPLKNQLEKRVNIKLIKEWDYIQQGKNNLDIRVNDTEIMQRVKNKIETKGLPPFNWPFLVKKASFQSMDSQCITSTSHLLA